MSKQLDYQRLLNTIRRQEPDRVPLAELTIDRPVKERFLGRPVRGLQDEVAFSAAAGYDYVYLRPEYEYLGAPAVVASGTALAHEASSSPHETATISITRPGPVQRMADLESYPWPDPDTVSLSNLQQAVDLIPTVDTALAFAGEPLVLRPWQNKLHFHAELVAIVGHDVAPGQAQKAADALLGYSLGLGIWDDAPVADLKNKVPRDAGVNTAYSYTIDGSRQQGRTILSPGELPPLDEMRLTMHVPGRPTASYYHKDLLLDGPRMLRECAKLVGFRRGDVICPGPSDAPVVVSADDRFPPGSVIKVEGPPFPTLEILIDDRRDPDNAPPWPGCEVDFIARYPHLRPTVETK